LNKAAEWFTRGATHDPRASFALGLMYESGEGVEKDFVKAAEWYEKAAEQGHVSAQHNLGVLYATGEGVSKDDAKAAEWFRKAAQQGDPSAQFYLATMYSNGTGVARDLLEAYKWASLAKDPRLLDSVKRRMTRQQLEEAKKLAGEGN
jgi:TPR repeat protein